MSGRDMGPRGPLDFDNADGAAETAEMAPHVHLEPGAIHCADRPTLISTILGSCVAVCLWDWHLRLGGMNHFMLPRWDGKAPASPRYGDLAIDQLIRGMSRLGCHPETMTAKVFGGADVLRMGPTKQTVGQQNVRQAMNCLSAYDIPVVAERTGGDRGISIKFDTANGEILLRVIRKTATIP